MIPLICAIFNRRTIEVSIVKKVNCAKTTRNETFINLANCYLKHCCDDVKKTHFVTTRCEESSHGNNYQALGRTLRKPVSSPGHFLLLLSSPFVVVTFNPPRHRQKLQPSREKSQQISWKIRDRIQGERTSKFDLLFPTRGDVVAKTFRSKRSW